MTATCGEPVHKRRLIRAGGVLDATGTALAPACVLVEGGGVVAWGRPEDIGPVPDAVQEDWQHSLLIPGLVNAHAHLDLSDSGIWPPAGDDFRGWVGRVRSLRGAAGRDVGEACRTGIELAISGGTAVVGDIVGGPWTDAISALALSPLRGVAYLEFFGIGLGREAAAAAVRRADHEFPVEDGGFRIGFSPHAPYSCDPHVYRAVMATGRPCSTHLAETRSELQLLAQGTGPLREMLEHDIGVWDEAVSVPACHPVDAIRGELAGMLCAHVNYLGPAQVETLAESGASVVYCPRASAAFGHGPPAVDVHPWRALAAAGVPVCLGTDSLLCLDTPDRISVWDDMRLLFQRDGIDPMSLLAMATCHGVASLGLEPALACWSSGMAGVLAVEAEGGTAPAMLERALRAERLPGWLLPPSHP